MITKHSLPEAPKEEEIKNKTMTRHDDTMAITDKKKNNNNNKKKKTLTENC